jgi:kynurenine formamidase
VSGEVAALVSRLVARGEVYDLAHPTAEGMPVHPFHHPYSMALDRRHGDVVRAEGASFANEVITTPAHAGTHIDALGHFSRRGRLHGGARVEEVETGRGLRRLDAAAIPLLVRRGVLYDIAGLVGVAALEPGTAVEASDLDACVTAAGVAAEPGDVALVRTGWACHWDDPEAFVAHQDGCPGVAGSGAAWLVDRGVVAVGTDTAGFEVYPQREVSVHARLLVDAGVYIIENLDLEELAAARCVEFLFVALPLRLVGATGSPLRPVALA